MRIDQTVKLHAANVQLCNIVKAFNGFTNVTDEQRKAATSNTLWVSLDSVGDRKVELWSNAPKQESGWYTNQVIFEMTKDRHGYDVRGYNAFWVKEVEFVSASSGSILKWVADEYPDGHKSQDGATGTFTWEQVTPHYFGEYHKAFLLACQMTDEYTDPWSEQ